MDRSHVVRAPSRSVMNVPGGKCGTESRHHLPLSGTEFREGL